MKETYAEKKDRYKKAIRSKIYCQRGEGGLIHRKDCIPGCNDICLSCENKQIKNVQAVNNTSPAEDRELNYTSSFGNSGALAAAEGNYSI